MEPQYTNREIDQFLKEINSKLDMLIIQTTKTNGNVKSLQLWRAGMAGAIGVLSILVIPLVFYMLDRIQ